MHSKTPLKTYQQYIDHLREVYFLLQINLRLNSRNYIKLGICCILINQYQSSCGRLPNNAIVLYSKIWELLQDKKKQEMMKRLGIQFMVDKKFTLMIDRKTFRLMPEILPGSQHL